MAASRQGLGRDGAAEGVPGPAVEKARAERLGWPWAEYGWRMAGGRWPGLRLGGGWPGRWWAPRPGRAGERGGGAAQDMAERAQDAGGLWGGGEEGLYLGLLQQM